MVQTMFNDERKGVILLSETKLMNDETAPKINSYYFIGSNRDGPTGQKSCGGVGILMPSIRFKEIWTMRGRDWIAHAVEGANQKWVFISVYVSHDERIQRNAKLFRDVSTVIREKCLGNVNLLIAGDFNAHLTEFAINQNNRGDLLKDFAAEHNLEIINLSEKWSGHQTRGAAVLDYALCNKRCFEKVTRMDTEKSILSDHDILRIQVKLDRKCDRVNNTNKKIISINKTRAAILTKQECRNSQQRGQKMSFVQLNTELKKNLEKSTKQIVIKTKYRVWSKIISQLDKEKRQRGKEWRHARKQGDETQIRDTELRFRESQRSLYEEISNEVAKSDKTMYDKIMHGPRNEKARRFWKYIKKSEDKVPREIELSDKDGRKISPEFLQRHLTNTLKELLEGHEIENENNQIFISPPAKLDIEPIEVKQAIDGMKKDSATGPDGIPIETISKMGQVGCWCLSQTFNNILEGEEAIPNEWQEGRVSMIEKSKSVKGDLLTYRPITVSSVTYRILAKILAYRIQTWIEDNAILGEMQNGFRPGRRGDDNLFILTSAIEISNQQKKGCFMIFLDATKAYDKVDRDKLWHILQNMEIPSGILATLKALYSNNFVKLKWGKHESQSISTTVGLKQGCPLSPILFILYIAELEKRLMESNLGIEIRTKGDFWNVRESKIMKIPGLAFADDIVIMSHKWEDARKLIQVVSDFGDERGLIFNPDKSAILNFGKTEVGHEIKIQGKTIPLETTYKYLGITLSTEGKNYLGSQEKLWIENAKIKLRQLHAKSIWKFNRFEVAKVLWKSTAVPALTYGNSVLHISKGTREKLEGSQRSAGRWALGQPNFYLANEFVEGELGWSSFEAREARGKLPYLVRIKSMDNHRWPKKVIDMIEMCNIKVQFTKRVRELIARFECEGLERDPETSEYIRPDRYVKLLGGHIKDVTNNEWNESMKHKTSLSNYRSYKKERGVVEHYYDNSRGSTLLACARAGFLKTKSFRVRLEEGLDTTCSKCGIKPETLNHVVMECNDNDDTDCEIEIQKRLGLHETSTKVMVNDTKRVLERWEKNASQT